jgi:hypothetical protein
MYTNQTVDAANEITFATPSDFELALRELSSMELIAIGGGDNFVNNV